VSTGARDSHNMLPIDRTNERCNCEAALVYRGTVETHVRSILGKLGLPTSGDDHRRVLAVLTYLRARRLKDELISVLAPRNISVPVTTTAGELAHSVRVQRANKRTTKPRRSKDAKARACRSRRW
jgi:hypothetical protein